MKRHVHSQITTINRKMLRKRFQNGANNEVGRRQKLTCIMWSHKRGSSHQKACSQITTINQKEQARKFKKGVKNTIKIVKK